MNDKSPLIMLGYYQNRILGVLAVDDVEVQQEDAPVYVWTEVYISAD